MSIFGQTTIRYCLIIALVSSNCSFLPLISGGHLTSSCIPLDNTSTCIASQEHCNEFTDYCSHFHPCLNDGTCVDDNHYPLWFLCICPDQISGDRCQNDDRPCQPNPCWNGGTCNGTSKTDYNCSCPKHWTGSHCEIKVNYCLNYTCYNKGVCRPLVGRAVCEEVMKVHYVNMQRDE